ncbi:MAG: hypothetical protein UX81_C0006G0007 [Parcubacteria group bacterium GW2011_GWA2_47_12]|nr:MAG: hypothetical protein UX81_C0006G0007 [Parcubacteria group bacterium GW2011_GWA2_47_12]
MLQTRQGVAGFIVDWRRDNLYNGYMLSLEMRNKIETATRNFWDEKIKESSFAEIAQGTEIGHRIADLVSDKTTGLLAVEFTAMFQRNKAGHKVPRSMGDIWIAHEGIAHPVNVKASIADNGGQPNMVSMKKLLAALLEYRIDSYYLLFVKISNTDELFSAKVHFVDMLDYLDYVTFDSGPGQIMLRSKDFFKALEKKSAPENKLLSQKVSGLVDLLEDGERRLIRNRRTTLKRFRTAVSKYNSSHHKVTPESQAVFHLL